MYTIQKHRKLARIISILVISIIYLTIPTSCVTEVEDTSVDRKWVDSLEKQQKVIIGLEMDSLCELRREKYIKNAVDSIMGERLEEMRKFDE